jgi:uncharacterized protein
MTPQPRSTRYLRAAMVALALVLPALSLIPLGSLWLWERGYLLYWVGAALTVVVATYLIEAQLVGAGGTTSSNGTTSAAPEAPDATWSPRETAAWDAVEALAAGIDPTGITSRDAVFDLGLRTVETVARNIHPQDQDPLWRFTVPEALLLIERVSRELRPFVADNVPLGDQLTIAQVLKIYRWRSAIGVADKAYDLWRIIRLINPVAAITNEARERLTKKLYSGVRDELAKRLTQGFVREVGRAAIDLYGGRLRVPADDGVLRSPLGTSLDRTPPATSEPLRVLVLGQSGAGQSALIDALLREVNSDGGVQPAAAGVSPVATQIEAVQPVLFVQPPALSKKPSVIKALCTDADASDLVIWVGDANLADRELDRTALAALRDYFETQPDRQHPPVMGVVIHNGQFTSDGNAPFTGGAFETAHEIARPLRAELRQASIDLLIPIDNIVLLNLRDDSGKPGIAAVWGKIADLLPEARRAQLARSRRRGAKWRWRKIWSQTANAGRSATRALSKRNMGNPP